MRRFSPDLGGMELDVDGGWLKYEELEPLLKEFKSRESAEGYLTPHERSDLLGKLFKHYNNLKGE